MLSRRAALRAAAVAGWLLGLCCPIGLAQAESADNEPSYRVYGEIPDPENLEDQIIEIRSLIGTTRIGGWLDFDFTYTDKTGQDPYFDAHHFYLYFDNRMNEKWQAFAEFEGEHAFQFGDDPDELKGSFKIDRLYIQYNVEQWLKLRAGKYNTRFGYWTPIHWAISMDTIQAPIHENNRYVPRKSVGLEAFGRWFPAFGTMDDLEIAYSGWFSNGSEQAGTNKPVDGRFGGGFDLRLLFQEKYLLGASWYQQSRPTPRIGTPGRIENSLMFYSNLYLPARITLRGELMYQFRDSGDPEILVGYAKIRWNFLENAYLNYRFGYGDDEKSGGGGIHAEQIVTLGYNPLPKVRFRVEYGRHDFKDPAIEDQNVFKAWIGYMF